MKRMNPEQTMPRTNKPAPYATRRLGRKPHSSTQNATIICPIPTRILSLIKEPTPGAGHPKKRVTYTSMPNLKSPELSPRLVPCDLDGLDTRVRFQGPVPLNATLGPGTFP